jgi:hypothetical protein
MCEVVLEYSSSSSSTKQLAPRMAHSIRTEKREDFEERKKVASGLVVVVVVLGGELRTKIVDGATTGNDTTSLAAGLGLGR